MTKRLVGTDGEEVDAGTLLVGVVPVLEGVVYTTVGVLAGLVATDGLDVTEDGVLV